MRIPEYQPRGILYKQTLKRKELAREQIKIEMRLMQIKPNYEKQIKKSRNNNEILEEILSVLKSILQKI